MRTIAIVNQKGGCGKTTTAINLSACLAQKKRRVLLIDLDPQSHASIGLDITVEELEKSTYDLFSEEKKESVNDVIVDTGYGFDIIPSQLILSSVEQELAGKMGRESVLLRSLQGMEGQYGYVVIDCPPSLGLLTINALRACSEALIPVEMSVFSLQGVARLLEIIDLLREKYGHEIRTSALATIFNARTLFAHEVLMDIEQCFEEDLYKTVIHATVKLKEAAGFGLPITKYNKWCRAAEDYSALATEVITDEELVETVNLPITLGPQKISDGIQFSYYDPLAKDVQIVGDFNNWEPVENTLEQEGGSKVWKIIIPLDPGKYQYKFIVDGTWKVDPHNPEVVSTEFGANNSLVEVSDH